MNRIPSKGAVGKGRMKLQTFPVPDLEREGETQEQIRARQARERWDLIERLLDANGYLLVPDLFEHQIKLKPVRNGR